MNAGQVKHCHACGAPVLSGFTCSKCREKGHTDLNCRKCPKKRNVSGLKLTDEKGETKNG